MTSKIKKTAIFGGSFNPPHFGHMDIVRQLEKRFDRVIVVPSYVSPFKTETVLPARIFSLCKKVFASEKTEVSRYEISKKGVSYSVDTAAHFAENSDERLFWVIGSEELTRLHEWHDIDRLKKLVTFYVVPRPNYDPDENTLVSLKKRKIKIKLAPFVGLDISSTVAKIDLAFGKPNRYLPSVVYDAAIKSGMFDPYGKYVKKLYDYGLKQSRIEHTYGVAVRGAELAKLYGGNVHQAVVACILHDIAKYVPTEKYADKVDLADFPPPTVHSPIGAYIVKNELGEPEEIARAVYLHTTGDDNMSLLDEIVYLADKTENGRNYDEVYYFRYLCGYDRNYALYRIMKEVADYENARKDSRECKATQRAIEKYKKLCEGVPAPEMGAERGARALAVLPEHGTLPAVGRQNSKAVRVAEKPSKAIGATADEYPKAHDKSKKPKKSDFATADEVKRIALAAAAELSLHKARDIDIVDLNGKTVIADYFVIASASSSTAVKALMGYVEDKLSEAFGLDPNKRDVNGEWVALDYGNVIIHIFTDKQREFYNIERLWADGSNIERYED